MMPAKNFRTSFAVEIKQPDDCLQEIEMSIGTAAEFAGGRPSTANDESHEPMLNCASGYLVEDNAVCSVSRWSGRKPRSMRCNR